VRIGLTALNMAARSIRAGDGEAFITGGVESMSRAPFSLPKPGATVGNLTAYDTALGWRYVNPRLEAAYGAEPMGITAENLAEMTGITREAQDEFALASHQRRLAAMDSGKFGEEILPVPIPQRTGEPDLFINDERPRRDTTLEALSRLKPAFKKDGTVTAGNSSGLNDGAAALLLMREDTAVRLGCQPLARVVSMASAGVPRASWAPDQSQRHKRPYSGRV
jgi:acetyl-CoA acetyltransferase family protein